MLPPELGHTPDRGQLNRGAFDLDEFEFAARPHSPGEVFAVGRMARPDTDKWSSNTWPIYSAIQYANRRALMLGMDDSTHEKLKRYIAALTLSNNGVEQTESPAGRYPSAWRP